MVLSLLFNHIITIDKTRILQKKNIKFILMVEMNDLINLV